MTLAGVVEMIRTGGFSAHCLWASRGARLPLAAVYEPSLCLTAADTADGMMTSSRARVTGEALAQTTEEALGQRLKTGEEAGWATEVATIGAALTTGRILVTEAALSRGGAALTWVQAASMTGDPGTGVNPLGQLAPVSHVTSLVYALFLMYDCICQQPVKATLATELGVRNSEQQWQVNYGCTDGHQV